MINTKISDSIFYIGVNDRDIDLFEGQYNVPQGISYNSYLIKDKKTALMDTVDNRKSDEWLSNLKKALDGAMLDYLVISHVEPDHSGSIKTITEEFPDITLVGNAKTFEMLDNFFEINADVKRLVVREGDTLNIGEHTLQFFMAPMVHWPEVMVEYEQKEKIVFSADGFGKFGAVEELYEKGNVEEDSCNSEWVDEARRYYINIVGKYGAQVQMLLKKLSTLDVKMICPLHGPILNKNLSYYINKYDIWSSYKPETKGVLVAFASIHGNTAKVANYVTNLLRESGEKNVKTMDLARDDIHEAVSQAFKYDRVILLASSYNMGIFTPMETFLNILKSKNYQNRKVGIIENGSWAPSAGRCMKEIISNMRNVEVIDPVVTIKSAMKKDDEKTIKELVNKMV